MLKKVVDLRPEKMCVIKYLKTRNPKSSVNGHVSFGMGLLGSVARHQAMAGKEMAEEHSQTMTISTAAFLPVILAG